MTAPAPERRRARATAKAAATAATLLALLVGVPGVLYTAGGPPWPAPAASLTDLVHRLHHPLGDRLAVRLLTLVGWACWAAFTITVLREVVWYLRHLTHLRRDHQLHARHLETLPALRATVAACLGTLILTLSTALRPGTADPPPVPAAAAFEQPLAEIADTEPVRTTPDAQEALHRASGESTDTDEAAPVRHIVEPGDTMWDISARRLGDPLRWPEIYRLSRHLAQPDGQRLSDPDHLVPRWHLHLPRSPEPPTGTPADEQPSEADEEKPSPTEPDDDASPPGPSGSTAPSTPPTAGEHRPERDRTENTNRSPEVTVGTAATIGITTATGIAAAVTLARVRTRRHHGTDLTTASPHLPGAVAAAAHAARTAQRAAQDDSEAAEAGITRRPAPSTPAPPGTVTCGHREGTEIPLDALATPGGWTLDGPGAAPAARALAIAILAAARRLGTTPPAVRLILPEPLADALLPPLGDATPSVLTPADASEAIHLADTARLAHARHQEEPTAAGRPPFDVLLLPGDSAAQGAGIARTAAPGQLAVLALHGAPLANTAHVDSEGRLTHCAGPHGHALQGATFHVLAPEPAAELLDPLVPTPKPYPAAVSVPDHKPEPSPPHHAPEAPSADDVENQENAAEPASPPVHSAASSPEPEREDEPPEKVRPPLLVRLFGGLSLHTASGEYENTMKGAAREFLALLAAHPDGMRTEALIDALRLSADPERATKDLVNLRRAVRRTVRHAAGSRHAAVVLHTADRHRLDPTLVRTDVADFTTALSRAARSSENAAERARDLQAALDLYHGPLCDGADYPWADELREHLHHKAIDAAVRLADHTAKDAPDQALALLERATVWEPTNEPMCQRLMRLCHELGRPEAAQHAYQRLARHLADIDATPTPESRALAGTPRPR